MTPMTHRATSPPQPTTAELHHQPTSTPDAWILHTVSRLLTHVIRQTHFLAPHESRDGHAGCEERNRQHRPEHGRDDGGVEHEDVWEPRNLGELGGWTSDGSQVVAS
jgi:hypothetical protein